ncbi:MAG: hypothetical protein KAG97_04685, partial [Victivallales bacterium]|nr:hypothetical protein [Victivallales bacterium]
STVGRQWLLERLDSAADEDHKLAVLQTMNSRKEFSNQKLSDFTTVRLTLVLFVVSVYFSVVYRDL